MRSIPAARSRSRRSSRLPSQFLILNLVLVLVLVSKVWAKDPVEVADPRLDTYKALTQWRFSKKPMAVPSGGLVIERDTARWVFESGELWLQERTPEGIVTGLVFNGKGRFTMTVPDPFELDQLRRFADEPELESIDEPFSKLVLRTPQDFLSKILPAAQQQGAFDSNKLAGKRHEEWLEIALHDADARVFYGLLHPGDDYLLVDMKTDSFDWLLYEFEPMRSEEIQLMKLEAKNHFVERWVSLDRPEERLEDGRPGEPGPGPVDLVHFDIEADFDPDMWGERIGQSRTQKVNAELYAEVRLLPLQADRQALWLDLNPFAKLLSVQSEDGTELAFVRDRIGKRFGSLDSKIYSPSLIVLLEEPAARGEPVTLRLHYELELVNYASGRAWYPGHIGELNDLHTARLTLRLPRKQSIRAVGTLVEETEDNNLTTSIWQVDTPAKMLGFTFGKNFREQHARVAGGPEVVAFGTDLGIEKGDMVQEVAEDIAGALSFLQEKLQLPLPEPTLYATSIASLHGQAFNGLLHLGERTFDLTDPGRSELFRAHEAAHQYFGLLLRWKTYRDQWLSESFAEYLAMLYVEKTFPDKDHFDDLLRVYSDELTGSIASTMSKFARPGLILMQERDRRQVGPIAAGYRAATSDVPIGYFVQNYQKGPLVLHMIRCMLARETGGDEAFYAVLSEFVRRFQGRAASTADFQQVLEEKTGHDWTWFFKQWIDGTALPIYRVKDEVSSSGDAEKPYRLALTVEQKDVPPGFRMPVPVEIELPNGETLTETVLVQNEIETFEILLAQKPGKIRFNAGYAVLARVK